MSHRFVTLAVLIVSLLSGAACSSSCQRQPPGLTDAVYRDVFSAFFTGVAAMQTTQEVLAREQFDRVVTLAPQEPAGWANRGLLLLRQQEIDQAREQLKKAAELAPTSPEIETMLALVESRAGNLPDAVRHWSRVLELRPADARAAFALARDTERQGRPEDDAAAQRTLEALIARHDNIAVRLELARIAAKRGDADTLQKAIAPLTQPSSRWSKDAQQQLQAVRDSIANPRAAATRVAFLKNYLVRDPEYRRAMSELTTPLEAVGEPLERFLVLKNPDPQPAARDEGMTFTVKDAPQPPGPSFDALVRADGGEVLAADLNYDFRTDLVTTGTSGIKVMRQEADAKFVDVTASTKVPETILRARTYGAWAADFDTDGDLDVVVAPIQGAPVVLRNNGDGTFATRTPFEGVTDARGFAWADFDGEGVPDAAWLQADGTVRLFLNLRGGSFRVSALPTGVAKAGAIAAVEVTGDALVDLIVLGADGSIARVSRDRTGDVDSRTGGVAWTVAALARVPIPPQEPSPDTPLPPGFFPGDARIVIGDLDNNGARDLIVSSANTSRVLLGGAGAATANAASSDATRAAALSFTLLTASLDLHVIAAVDLDDDGRLDLVGEHRGVSKIAVSRGTKTYHWQRLRPRAATATGDQRINSFGIGGEVEVRAGLHVQKVTIASPIVHVGLGEATQAEVIRIIWPNGVLQSEFAKKADTTIAADQRLKGSCPWLFAWNGREMTFVTDLIWRSPLGLRINAQATADVAMTEDWVKVRGDQLVARDGAYDLRITADLWETHFFDLVSLLVVDHPADTEVFVDERFTVPAPPLDVAVTGPVHPFAAVRSDDGRDASEMVRARDDRHLDFAGRGAYQGVTRDHAIEIELPDDAPREGPLWLVAQGWVHPTDSSINVALSQGAHAPPRGLSLAVADERGRFREVRSNLGFPAGKDKTVLLDLTKLFPAHGKRTLRLSTNLEIFWDRLGWAVGRPDVRVTPRRLALSTAELRYRGFNETVQPNPSTPERPRYRLAGMAPRWRDLEGFYTRFGDVRELLLGVDDRYVIMNAGDELALRFPEAPPPAAGLVRDFVVIGDGWEKDGDFNTAFSRTVLPLPTHASPRYDRPPGRLEDDPVFRTHPADFEVYHTRYVSPDRARDALQPAPRPGSP